MLIRQGGITAYLFPPSRLGIFAVPEGSNLRRAHGFAALSTGAAAVLDGSMYSDIGSGLARPRFLMHDPARGVSVATRSPRDGMTISVLNGVAYARSNAEAVEGASVAVQLYPELVRSGRNVASTTNDTSTVWRAGLGIYRDGRLGFAVGLMPMFRFASGMRDMGFVDAGYTDGGDSTLLLTRDEGSVGDPDHRAVSSWLMDVGDRAEKNDSGLGTVLAAAGLTWLMYELSK